MSEAPEKDDTKAEALRKEVSRLKIMLAGQTARADKAEKDLETTKKAHDKELADASSSMEYVINDYEERLLVMKSKCKSAVAIAEATKSQLQRKTAEYEKGVKREDRWAEDVKQLVRESKEKDQKLGVAQREAATAKEQVMKIWAEMKKSKEAEPRKRGACSDAAGSEAKKAKVET